VRAHIFEISGSKLIQVICFKKISVVSCGTWGNADWFPPLKLVGYFRVPLTGRGGGDQKDARDGVDGWGGWGGRADLNLEHIHKCSGSGPEVSLQSEFWRTSINDRSLRVLSLME
jgi:hypothetical protein